MSPPVNRALCFNQFLRDVLGFVMFKGVNEGTYYILAFVFFALLDNTTTLP